MKDHARLSKRTYRRENSNDIQNDHATIGIIVVHDAGGLTRRTTRRRITFERQFQTWADFLTPAALPFFSLANLLDDERR